MYGLICSVTLAHTWQAVRMATFWKMCRDGDLECVMEAVEEGQDINGGNGVKTTGLMRAVAGDHNDLVEVLLHQDRIDINSSESLGYRALHWASYSGNVTRLRSHWLKILVV